MPDEENELLERVRGATSAIGPRPDAVGIVRARVGARRRRRTTLATGLSAAVVAGVAVLAVVIDRSPNADPPSPGPAVQGSDPPSAIEGTLYRPAGFFADVIGGRATPREVTYRPVRGVKFYAVIDWWPTITSDESPYLVDIALERIAGTPDDECAALATGAPCLERGDGEVVTRYEIAAGEAFLDPVHRSTALGEGSFEGAVRGVTYLRPDGWAVSVLVCSCGADGSAAGDQPPLTLDRLEEVASSDTWVRVD